MVLVITLSPIQKYWATVTLPLFFVGCVILLSAVVLEIAELTLAAEIVSLESTDL